MPINLYAYYSTLSIKIGIIINIKITTNLSTMKRFLLSVTLVLGIITSTIAQGVSVWDGSSTIWTNGSGTSSDPYLIESAANLAYLATSVNSGTTYSGKYFKQTVDIDLDAIGWTPIGTSSYTFQGTYNGNHKRIKNLSIYVNGASPVHIGLFGYVSSANNTKC